MSIKVRSEDDFQNLTDGDLQWRKRELSAVWSACNASAPKAEFQRNARASICLQYAHFEGYFKTCVNGYLAFVNSRSLPIGGLCPELVAVCLRTQLSVAAQARMVGQFAGVIHGILRATALITIPEGMFSNIGNLDSNRLEDFIRITGVPLEHYESRFAFIDQKLVHNRNNIAHGQFLGVDYETVKETHRTVVDLIDQFRTDIQNSVSRQSYKR